MATKKVNIDIIARDKSQRALKSVRGSLDRLKSSVFNVRNALAGLGAGLVIRNLVNTGKEIESLKVRLKFLFGSAEEGAKAFDKMAKFASKVPFSLQEIQAGSGNLAVVAKDAEELSSLLEITGNVAAATGLDFRTTAEQIQRSFSAGIGAADLFRDRGVRAMLGFKAGATVSINETIKRFEEVFGAGGEFGGTTDALAQTLEGTLSMIGDKVFNFKKTLLDAGFFAELKRQFGDLDKFLEKNSETLDKVAIQIGENLAKAVIATAEAFKTMANNMETVKIVVAALLLAIAPIPTSIGLITLSLMKLRDETFRIRREMFDVRESFDGLSLEQLEQEFINITKRINDLNNLTVLQKKSMGAAFSKELFTLQEALDDVNKRIELFKQLIVEIPTDSADGEEQNTNNIKSELDKQLKAYKLYGHLRSVQAHRQAAKQAEINKMGLEQITTNTRDSLAAVSGLNRTAFEANKRLQIAEATINAFKGASTAFSVHAGNPFMASAVAASHLVKGMALVAQIKSTSFREKGGPVSQGKPFIVGERGPEMFVPNQSGNIISNNKMGGNPVAVTFNINTVDARGFNELLTNSRGVIVGMINSAVNETGRKAIV
jgi:hypothetical protein